MLKTLLDWIAPPKLVFPEPGRTHHGRYFGGRLRLALRVLRGKSVIYGVAIPRDLELRDVVVFNCTVADESRSHLRDVRITGSSVGGDARTGQT